VWLLLCVGLVTAFFAYQAMGVEKSQEFARVVPTDDPDYQNYMAFKASFGEDGNTVLVGLQGDSLFTPARLNALRNFCLWADSLEGVQDVLSITQAQDLQVDDSLGIFRVVPLVQAPIASKAEANALRRHIRRLRFYEGLLLSQDGRTTVVAITLTKSAAASKQKHQLVQDIKDKAQVLAQAHRLEYHMVGLPYTRSYMSTQIAKELNFFMAGAILLTAISLFAFYRSWYAVVIPLVLLGVSSTVTIGLVGLFGYKLNILSALLPPIIVIIGIPPCIYILGEYYEEYKHCRHKRLAMAKTVRRLGVVTLLINLTTAMGFFTLSFTQVTILQEFGKVAFLATILSYLFTMIIIPGVFTLLPPPRDKNLKFLEAAYVLCLVRWADHLVMRRKVLIYGTTLVLVAVALVGISRLKAISFMVDDLPKDDAIRADIAFLEGHFKGVMPFEIVINTGQKGGLKKLKHLKKLDDLQTRLDKHPELSRTLSLADVMKWSRQSFMGGDRAEYHMPAREELSFIAEYADNTRLHNRRQQKASGEQPRRNDVLTSLVDSTYQVARITGFVSDLGSEKMPELIARVQADVEAIYGKDIVLRVGNGPAAEDSSLLAKKLEYFVTGTTNIFLKANGYLVNNLYWSLLATFTLVSLMMYFLFRSVRIMLISVVPNLVPLIFTAGVMGLLGINLKPSTALIYQIAFGIAIDDTIHYLGMYRLRRKSGLSIPEAVSTSIRTTGMSIIYTSLVLFAGFVIFSQSRFGSTQALGVLMSVTLLIAMFSNLLLLPTLLLKFDRDKSTQGPAPIDPPADLDSGTADPIPEDTRSDS
jgi:predicted RND superfamily exporter protein